MDVDQELKGPKLFRNEKELEYVLKRDPVGMLQAQQEVYEDMATDVAEVRIMQEALQRCFMYNAPIHIRKCKHLVKPYADMLSKYSGFTYDPHTGPAPNQE